MSARAWNPDEAAPWQPLRPGSRIGAYVLGKKLAQGGFSLVYHAFNSEGSPGFVVKEFYSDALRREPDGAMVRIAKRSKASQLFHAESLARLREEFRLMSSMPRHKALATAIGFVEANGTAYLVLPFYVGRTLEEHLSSLPRPLPEAWLTALISQLASALAALHRAGIIHRDVKAMNVLLSDDGRATLLDFGAARSLIEKEGRDLTQMLTFRFASPEQRDGKCEGPWSDCYMLATLIYYLIARQALDTDEAPHTDPHPMASAFGADYSPSFIAALDHALKLDFKERTPSIDELCSELGIALDPEPSADDPLPTRMKAKPPIEAPQPLPVHPRAFALRTVVGLVLAGCALAGCTYLLVSRPAPPRVDTTTVVPPPAPAAPPEAAPPPTALLATEPTGAGVLHAPPPQLLGSRLEALESEGPPNNLGGALQQALDLSASDRRKVDGLLARVFKDAPNAQIFLGVSHGQITLFFNGDQTLCAEQHIENCRVVAEKGHFMKKDFFVALKSLHHQRIEVARTALNKEVTQRLQDIRADDAAQAGGMVH